MVSSSALCSRLLIGWVVILTWVATLTWCMPLEQYMASREGLIKADREGGLGRHLVMTKEEKLVSDTLVKEKRRLIEESRLGGKPYFPSLSFYKSKPLAEKSLIFDVIRKMPKGGILHAHDMSITSLDWLVANATYRDNLFMCVDQSSHLIHFRFFKTAPADHPSCPWKSVRTERSLAGSVDEFDASLKHNVSLLATDPFESFPTITQVWNRFNQYFMQIAGLVFYEPVFIDYFRQALQEFSDDNVQYLELRGVFSGLYDLEGNTYGPERVLDLYRNVTEEFVKGNPGFSGAKFIITSIRNQPTKNIESLMKISMQLHKKYPDSMVGYDLVGQEDPNHPLLFYLKELLMPSQQTDSSGKLPFFFHAAETDWQGTATDDNLVDAILLNTTRIGHGYGLVKHPKLVSLVREKGIAVEVNPISNQLLGLVKDLRNHAMVPLMMDDFPVVVSSDDPANWEALPLSHDFFMAFMNMCGEETDLRFLKQLAINSIKYSAMNDSEKETAMKLFDGKWKKFIHSTAQSLGENGSCDSA